MRTIQALLFSIYNLMDGIGKVRYNVGRCSEHSRSKECAWRRMSTLVFVGRRCTQMLPRNPMDSVLHAREQGLKYTGVVVQLHCWEATSLLAPASRMLAVQTLRHSIDVPGRWVPAPWGGGPMDGSVHFCFSTPRKNNFKNTEFELEISNEWTRCGCWDVSLLIS